MKLERKNQIIEAVRSCGVVGAGGAGFPTHVKLSSSADVAIVNGVECEPLLESDKYLLGTECDGILNGLGLIMESCGAKKGYIALKEKHSRLILTVEKAIRDRAKNGVSPYPLGDYYPAGDEFLLVFELTGRVIPERGIPPHVGCIVQNVETAFNIHRAVENGEPVTRRYLTCTGEVRTPSIVRAHIGVTFREVIDLCGGSPLDDPVLIIGGPLMGRVETDLDAPVTKLTSGIIVLSRDHKVVSRKTIPLENMIRQSKGACCQCTYCTELCPRYLIGHDLMPHMIMRQIAYGIEVPPETIENALLCSECGLCEIYACVMGLSPKRINALIKESLSAKGYRPEFPRREMSVHEMRDFRKIPSERVVNRLQLLDYTEVVLKRGVETNPSRVEILFKQHTGEPAVPVVRVGDRVSEGMLIADVPKSVLGARVHSSIEGEVVFIDGERIIIQR